MDRTDQLIPGVARVVFGACMLGLAGCSMHIEPVVRPSYRMHGRVAILGDLSRNQEELFVPLYMKAFPYQALVERRDLSSIIGEQDLSPERLRNETRAKLKQILGVSAIVYPRYTDGAEGQLSVKVIDTESGEIVAAVLVTKRHPFVGKEATDRRMIYRAIDALRSEAESHSKVAFGVR